MKRWHFALWAVLGLVGIYLGYRFPDLDIRLLGIGRHRHFLFHSCAIAAVAMNLRRPAFALAFMAGISTGLGLHLLEDVFQTKAVMFPIVNSLVDGTSLDDRLWEGGHAAVCAYLAWRYFKRLRIQVAIATPGVG